MTYVLSMHEVLYLCQSGVQPIYLELVKSGNRREGQRTGSSFILSQTFSPFQNVHTQLATSVLLALDSCSPYTRAFVPSRLVVIYIVLNAIYFQWHLSMNQMATDINIFPTLFFPSTTYFTVLKINFYIMDTWNRQNLWISFKYLGETINHNLNEKINWTESRNKLNKSYITTKNTTRNACQLIPK